MRIALFSDTYLPDVNGVVTSVELLRKKLVERGHEVYVVCTYPGLLKVVKEGNIIRLPGLEMKKLYGYAVTAPIHPLLYEDIEKLDLDLCHIHTEFGVGIFGEMVAEHFHIPIVRTYHTTYEDYTHYINFLGLDIIDKYGKKAIATFSKLLANRAMRMISPSKKTKDLLERYGVTAPIDIIPTGIELERFKEPVTEKRISEIHSEVGLPQGYKMILYVGRIAEEKSLEMLIESFEKLKATKAKLKLVIIGGGPQLKSLKELVKTKDLDDYIYMGGKRPFDIIADYYHSADAFVSASTSETQGMTYIEAMATGLIVFARRDEAISDLLEEGVNGWFFDSADELVQKLTCFASLDDGTLKRMSKESLSVADDFDADSFVDKVLVSYENVIHDHNDLYLVADTKHKDDHVVVELTKADKTEIKLLVSPEDFYSLGIRKKGYLHHEDVLKLQRQEVVNKAYQATLRKLAIRDNSEYEIEKYLLDKHGLSPKEISQIVSRLKEHGLIDDHNYATNKVSLFASRFLSRRRMIADLKKVHISDEIIAEVISDDDDREYQSCLKRAERYRSSIRDKSLRAKKLAISRKLYNDGFGKEMIDRAIEALDFSEEVMSENDAIRKEAAKQIKHYSRHYEGAKLRNKVLQALVSRGFSYDDTYVIINEMEWEDE